MNEHNKYQATAMYKGYIASKYIPKHLSGGVEGMAMLCCDFAIRYAQYNVTEQEDHNVLQTV